MKKILLFGKDGQVGWELQRTMASLGEIIAHEWYTCDFSDADMLRRVVRETAPDFIVNAAAYTAVDRAENEFEKARAINVAAPGILAEEAKSLGAAFIHYSTDFVYDGKKGTPYVEDDAANPLSAYGRTKWEGDQAVQAVGGSYLLLRTAWVYSTRRPSFVTKVQGWARKFPQLKIVTDQISSPTCARMLAEITAQVIAMGSEKIAANPGIYHVAGSGAVSRNAWAQAIIKHDPKPDEIIAKKILPAITADFPTPAVRPVYSALNCDKLADTYGLRLPHWETALKMALDLD